MFFVFRKNHYIKKLHTTTHPPQIIYPQGTGSLHLLLWRRLVSVSLCGLELCTGTRGLVLACDLAPLVQLPRLLEHFGHRLLEVEQIESLSPSVELHPRRSHCHCLLDQLHRRLDVFWLSTFLLPDPRSREVSPELCVHSLPRLPLDFLDAELVDLLQNIFLVKKNFCVFD